MCSTIKLNPQLGVWTYRLRLYDSVELPEHGLAVEVSCDWWRHGHVTRW